MDVGGRGVARLAGVDDDHRSTLPAELEGGGESGGGPADDGGVAVPHDGARVMVAHRAKVRSEPNSASLFAIFARGRDVVEPGQIEQVVRNRLRSLRTTMGLSLDDLAGRTNLSPSTISRIETGKRTISLDVLLPLARALQIEVDALLDIRSDDDVVIHPTSTRTAERTTWMLSRPTGSTLAVKMRLQPTERQAEQQVHPGHDWFFVLEGRVRLSLGARQLIVEAGQAAEFSTMTPHAVAAADDPAELIMIFDRDGQRAHIHHDVPAAPAG